MSLTSFVRTPDILKKILAYWPLPAFSLRGRLLAPPLTKNYALVGTAFDYLLRFYIKRLYPDAVEKEWIAELAIKPTIFFTAFEAYKNKELNKLRNCEIDVEGAILYEKIKCALGEAKNDYSRFLITSELKDSLLSAVIKLAKLDAVYRGKYIDKNIEIIDPLDITDLKQLCAIIPKEIFTNKRKILLNPTFPKGSEVVGGADCDIILDDLLIDIKTTKSLDLKKEVWAQIIGYIVLSDIAHETDKKFPKPEKFGIYFSRYGLVWEYDLKKIYEASNYKEFRKWFEEEAVKRFKKYY